MVFWSFGRLYAREVLVVSSLRGMVKAMRAYESRGEGMRHGIALDKQVTIFLSEVEGEEKPMCGIYFNLHSPYKKTQPITEPAESTD